MIEKFFIKFDWYKKWQANRSRKRLAKESSLVNDKIVEGFQVSPTVLQKENARRDAILEARNQREKERLEIEAQEWEVWRKTLETLYPGCTIATLSKEQYSHCEDVWNLAMDKFHDERNAKKS